MDAKQTDADDAQTSPVDVRTTDLSEFEDGETIRVHYRDDPTEPSETVTGVIQCHYTDRRVLIETDEDRRLVVDLSDVAADGGLRDFDTAEVLGRPMFAETAYHVEKDGHDLRTELLGDDDQDDEETPDTLVYENTVHRADETGADYTRTRTVEIYGTVTDELDDGATVFEGQGTNSTVGGDGEGTFYLRQNGIVYVERSDGTSTYEVGDNGRVE